MDERRKKQLKIASAVLAVILIIILLVLRGCKKPDIQPPTIPDGLSANALSPYEMSVMWNPSTDDTAVAEYRVYQKQELLETTKSVSSEYTGLTPDRLYCYAITAIDLVGNESAKSKEVCARTPGLYVPPPIIKKPPQPPTAPRLKALPANPTQITVNWEPSKAEAGLSHYILTRKDGPKFKVSANTYADTGLTPNTRYCYSVIAVDKLGAESVKSNEDCAVTPTAPDTKPPTTPTLKATAISPHQINLTWTASTDDRALAGYKVYYKGAVLSTETDTFTSYAHTNLNPETNYCYHVTAFDAAGNESAKSNQACATTPTLGDKLPPSVPAGLSLLPISPTQINLSWNPSTDNVGVTGYKVFKDNALYKTIVPTALTYQGKLPQKICFAVSAFDAAGNESERCQQVCVTTKQTGIMGTVFTSGNNEYGQLGDGSQDNRDFFVQAKGLTSVIKASAGMDHSIAIKANGTVWAWGRNTKNELGDGTNIDKSLPLQIKESNGMDFKDVSTVSAGWYHTIALKRNGTIWTWGRNVYGQLGNGSYRDSSSPTPTGIKDVIAIAAGWYHGVAVKRDGTVWTWGWNKNGQLGDGSTVDSSRTPVQVPGLENVVAVAAGQNHTLALKRDGSVWAWGENHSGQLGDGSSSSKRKPVQVKLLSNIKFISAGGSHSVAVKSDGTVWTWGGNNYGQLGDGTTVSRELPGQVAGFGDVTSIDAGNDTTVCVKKDGTVWMWGWDLRHKSKGQNVPTRIPNIEGAIDVSAGLYHIIVVKGE